MFYQKPTSAATNGNSTQYYSNTNPSNNGRIVEADSPKLQPGDAQPPYSPDTITPPLVPTAPSTNLLLPVGGSFGKVFVLATKPALNAAVVVVEATNDYMVFDKSIDTNYFGKKLKDLEEEPEETEEEPVWTPDEKYFLDIVVKQTIDALTESVYNLTGVDSPAITNAFKSKIERDPKVNAFVKYVVDNLLTAEGTYYDTNKMTPFYVFGKLTYEEPTVELMAFLGTGSSAEDDSVSFGVFPRINPVTEAYLNSYKTGGTSTVRIQLFVAVDFAGYKFSQIGAWLGLLCGLTVTIKFYYPGSCYPVADTTQPPDVDNITLKSLTGEIAIVPPPDEPPLPENEYKGYVRRAYINIGGKLKYLYSVDTTQETTVHLNYDGSNYGCKLIITAPQETAQTVNITTAALTPNASFNNNVNGINLTGAQQTALEQCLPQPDATLKGGFAATSSTGAAVAFKSYGFESIFYKTRSPVAYNDTILKACAIYGL